MKPGKQFVIAQKTQAVNVVHLVTWSYETSGYIKKAIETAG
jgi:hypothetical protein